MRSVACGGPSLGQRYIWPLFFCACPSRILPLTEAESRFAIKTVNLLCSSHHKHQRCAHTFLSQASVTVRDIPDLRRGGQDLGSVVFSESFLESSINIQQEGKNIDQIKSDYSRSTPPKIMRTIPRAAASRAPVSEYPPPGQTIRLVIHLLVPFHSSERVLLPTDGGVTTDGCSTVLTTTVPPYACWLVKLSR